MYHSIIFCMEDGETYNTWDDWGLLADPRPSVVPPTPKYNIEEVPYGSLVDYTNALYNDIAYQPRESEWKFMIVNQDISWDEILHSVTNALAGKKGYAFLEDETGWGYFGRFYVTTFDTGANWSTLTIGYYLDPYRYAIDYTSNIWEPSEGDVVIHKDLFYCSGTERRVIVNTVDHPIDIRFTVNAWVDGVGENLTVTIEDETYQLSTGEDVARIIQVPPGRTGAQFSGNGTILMEYGPNARSL